MKTLNSTVFRTLIVSLIGFGISGVTRAFGSTTTQQLNESVPFLVMESLQGTYGGGGGTAFEDLPEEPARISKIKVRAGWWIDAIQVTWERPDGSTKAAPQRGGKGGGEATFTLQKDEYIKKITGEYGTYVGSLTFHTNKRKSPTYGLAKGNGKGKPFELKAPEGSAIVGFHGHSGGFLHNLGGVIIRPVVTIGGSGGKAFKDLPEEPARISKIKVRAGWWIDAIQATWERPDGSTKAAPQRGGKGGGEATFALQKDEYITGISGEYGTYVGSLTFHTNKRTSPAYGAGLGNGDGNKFRIKAPKGSAIVGFHGHSGGFLHNLGVVIRPIEALN